MNDVLKPKTPCAKYQVIQFKDQNKARQCSQMRIPQVSYHDNYLQILQISAFHG